jgi:hypothetical protein
MKDMIPSFLDVLETAKLRSTGNNTWSTLCFLDTYTRLVKLFVLHC